MIGYVILKKDVEFLDGQVDFAALGLPYVYAYLSNALDSLNDKSEEYCIYQVEFLRTEEVIDAINGVLTGDQTYTQWHVKWLSVITKTNLKP